MKSSRKTKGPKQSKKTRNMGCNRRHHLRGMLEFGEVDVVLAFVGKGGNKVTTDHKHLKDNKGFGLDVEGNNTMDLQEDLKAFIQDYKGKHQRNKACRWTLGQ